MVPRRRCAPSAAELKPTAESPDMETYELPDGNITTVCDERFRCPEVPFQPKFIGKEASGIHDMSFLSIMECDVDIRKGLVRQRRVVPPCSKGSASA